MSDSARSVRRGLDWGKLAPLSLRARTVADGVYAGAHRSPRRGPGVEFGGHRSYVPGDDLRWLDRRALMRHGRLMVREFETDTDRAVRLIVDASASMGYRSPEAPGAKLAFAALVAAALARVALSGGDPVALDFVGGADHRPLPATGGREAFERLVSALESVEPGGDVHLNLAALDHALARVARHARRGSVVVLFSDLLDLPEGSVDRFAALATRGRILIVVQVLDPAEATFPFQGPLRLRASEGDQVIETDGDSVRAGYLENLAALQGAWRDRIVAVGGRLVTATSTDDPVSTLHEMLLAIRGGGA